MNQWIKIIEEFVYLFLDNLFACHICKSEFKSFEELEEHLKTHQLESKSTNLHLTCGNDVQNIFIKIPTYFFTQVL